MAGGLRVRILTDKKSMAATKASINRFVASTSRNMQLGMSAAGNASGAILTGGIFDAMKSLTKKMGPIGTAAGIAGGVAIATGIGIGMKSLKASSEFEDEMNQSVAIMDGVTARMRANLEAQALAMTRVSRFTAPELAGAYFYLTSAGLNYEQSLKALPATTRFATAGMFDLKQATDLLTDAQSALGLKHADAEQNYKQMVRLSDLLVRANTLANASVEQFSIALTTKSGAALKVFNFGVEEGIATLAALADQGIKAQRAGDALSISLRNLTTTAVKNREEYAKYNIAVFDSEGNTRRLANIVGDLERALEGKSDEMKKAILLELGFADRAQATLLALLGTSESIARYEAELKKAGGTTEEVANVQMSGLAAKTALLRNAFNEMFVRIGGMLSPFAKRVVDGLTGMFQGISDFIDRVKSAFDSGASAWGQRLTHFANVAREMFGALWEAIHARMQMFVEAIRVLWDSGFLQHMVTGLFEMTISLMNIIRAFAEVFGGVWKALTLLLQGEWGKAWEVLYNGLVAARDAILQAFLPLINGVISLIEILVNGIIGGIEKGLNAVIGLVNKVIQQINRIPGMDISMIQDVSIGRVDLSGLKISKEQFADLTGSKDGDASRFSPGMHGPPVPGRGEMYGPPKPSTTSAPDSWWDTAGNWAKGLGIGTQDHPWRKWIQGPDFTYEPPTGTTGGSTTTDKLGDEADRWAGQYDPRSEYARIQDDIKAMESLLSEMKAAGKGTEALELAIATARMNLQQISARDAAELEAEKQAERDKETERLRKAAEAIEAAERESDREMDARYKMGDLSRGEYLAHLRKRLNEEQGEDEFGPEALSIFNKIETIEREMARETADAAKKAQKSLDEIAKNTGITKETLLADLRTIELRGHTAGPGYRRKLGRRGGGFEAGDLDELQTIVRKRAAA